MSANSCTGDPSFLGIPARWVALLALVGQTVASVAVLRLSRTAEDSSEPAYLTTTAVVSAETMKLLTALPLVWYEQNMSFRQTAATLYRHTIGNPTEMAKVGVPGLLYAVQNNLIFIALSNLPGALYQVTYQLKILTTALLSVFILRRRLSSQKWTALFLLSAGVTLIQYPGRPETLKVAAGPDSQSAFVGMMAVLFACLTSGLAGVYLEKLLKQKTTTLWVNNMQLAIYGVLAGLVGAYWNDGAAIKRSGFFQGYNRMTVAAILLQAVGGLVVAAVLKYADNILKCFGNALSIVFSCVFSWLVVSDFSPTPLFCFGTCLVLVATYLYVADGPPRLLSKFRVHYLSHYNALASAAEGSGILLTPPGSAVSRRQIRSP